MALEFLVNRIKALFVVLLGAFRRAMCCLRRRRRSSCDSIPLSAVGVIPNVVNNRPETEQWDQWEENPVVVVSDKPCNIIQSKIEQYRQQVAKPPEPEENEQQANFFEDMTPKITRQTKVVLRDKRAEQSNWDPSKFAVANERIPTNELGIWEDNTTSWEDETVEEFGDPTEALREQRRRERERRLFEQQQQKRMEYNFRPQPLGEKIGS